ncbi:ArsR/SmtB family transcription factor [Brucellaceae bacterium C25G]
MKEQDNKACSLAIYKIEDEEAARIYAALAHPVRLTILRQLSLHEACCKDIVGGHDLAQSTVSQHLKVLVQAGLIDFRSERQNSRYSVNQARLTYIKDHFDQLSLISLQPPTCD